MSSTHVSNAKIDELAAVITPLGFLLDEHQPYVSGERYLMAGGKFVLAGKNEKTGAKVIIKISNAEDGIQEISSEKKARDLMRSLEFADKKIRLPEEEFYGTRNGYTILVMQFIPQDTVFVSHDLKDQFFIALSAFEAQESFHATTYEHLRDVKRVFPVLESTDYVRDFARLRDSILRNYADEELRAALSECETFLTDNVLTIDRYANYLTHTDFVPHNFRVFEHTLFMLDCVPNYATIHFGNKYEGWARFVNYMTLHNPSLEKLLVDYVRTSRGEDEYLSLRLMRAYKIVFLLEYYARSLSKTEGDLHLLTKARLAYWRDALIAVLHDEPLASGVTEEYKKVRDSLRSEEEKARQREFAVA